MVQESKKTFHLDGKHQQLLDINKDVTHFVAEFSVTPHVLEFEVPYKVAVVSQTDLDNQTDIDFKDMRKAFAGSVKNIDGDAQNYFLAIKSDQPMKNLVFSLKLSEMAPPAEQQLDHMPNQHQHMPNQPPSYPHMNQEDAIAEAQQIQAQNILARQHGMRENFEVPNPNKSMTWKYIVAFFTVVAGAFLIYYFWKTRKDKKESTSLEGDDSY